MKQQRANASNRIEKLNSLIQKLVGEILHSYLKSNDGLTTVSKVEVSKDTKWAKVWVSIIGGDDEQIMKEINKNIYHIQGELNRQIDLKLIPRLQFHLDTSPRYAQHINDLIRQIHEEDEQK